MNIQVLYQFVQETISNTTGRENDMLTSVPGVSEIQETRKGPGNKENEGESR